MYYHEEGDSDMLQNSMDSEFSCFILPFSRLSIFMYVIFLFGGRMCDPAFSADFTVSTFVELATALSNSESNGESDTITVLAGHYSVNTPLIFESSEDFSLTITGIGIGDTILDGGHANQILSMSTTMPNGNITIRHITFQDGTTDESGGALAVSVDAAGILLESCEFRNCSATSGDSVGGAVNVVTDTGTIEVTGCQVRNNTSAGNVGGIFAGTGTGIIHIIGCLVEENAVSQAGSTEPFGDGGGAMCYTGFGGEVTVEGCTFLTNTASGGANPDGGGLMTYLEGSGSSLVIQNNTFTGNQAGLDGGGCFSRINDNGSIVFNGNEFSSNAALIADGGGALIHLNEGEMEHQGNTYSDNSAGEDGGGVWIFHGSGHGASTGNTYHLNVADRNGGGLTIVSETAQETVTHEVFRTNQVFNVGGGFSYATNSGIAELSSNTFYDNTADAGGGGLYAYLDQNSAVTTLRNNIFWHDSPNAFAYGSGTGTLILTMTYSDAENGTGEQWFGSGCIDEDPFFVSEFTGDFYLNELSPCIDTGDPGSPADPDGSRADMGAFCYENIPPPVPALSSDAFFLLLLALGGFIKVSADKKKIRRKVLQT